MSKKKYKSPFQMAVLSGTLPYRPSGWDDVEAKPDPFLDEEEEEEIFLPDGGSVMTDGEDIVITPDATGGIDIDEAYY